MQPPLPNPHESRFRRLPGGWVDPKSLPQGENGKALCRWCGLEVSGRRRTFCSDYCVFEFKLRSNPGFLREQVLKRDRGICALCRCDTLHAWLTLKRSRAKRRVELLAHWAIRWGQRRSLWDADHIVPVAEGGGECDLSNLRTLCLRCHREQTRQLRERLKQKNRQDPPAA